MLLSTNQELRLHIPSNAVDDVSLLSGIIDNSEKDFLRDKLGSSLYAALCEYYSAIEPTDFYESVLNGSYTATPMAELLLNAQRMITNDALARFAYQQVISVNGAGINVVSGNDYGNADDRLLDKGVGGYKKEAAIACNNLLTFLEDLAKTDSTNQIVTLWKQSKYYYYQDGLLIPTAEVLQQYLDIYDNRDKFIRLLPDLRFIQKNYIRDAFGKDFITQMLAAPTDDDLDLLDDVRTLIALYLEERTIVLTIDKTRRQQAHNEAVAKKDNILATIKVNAQASTSNEMVSNGSPVGSTPDAYQNNQKGSKIFVSPLLY